MAGPDVSVIVPAHDAGATLPAALAALAAQDFEGNAEIAVVDDCSGDDTAAIANAAGVRVVRTAEQLGPAGARNAGIAATSARLLAFTDADCLPAPGWLSAMVSALGEADLVAGPVLPAGVPGPFDRTVRVAGPSPRFETANLGVRRQVVEAVGGFEAFVRPPDHFGEDALFGWRAKRAGARFAFAPDALVHHAIFPRTASGYVAEKWRLRFFPLLVRAVPELRGELPNGVFLSPRTRRFDAALLGLGLALGRRAPWWLAMAGPYVRRDLRTWSALTRGGVAENAAHVTGDAVGLVALLRGSVAARRLLL